MLKFFLWLHVIAAMTYVGGMIFLAAALVPFARKLDPEIRGKIISGTGKKFRVLSWIAIALLIISGFAMLGIREQTSLIGSYGPLNWKLGIFALMILLTFLHDWVIGSRSSRDPGDINLRLFSSWTGRLMLLLGLLVIWLAANLNLYY